MESRKWEGVSSYQLSVMVGFRRDKSLPQFVEARSSGLARQPEGLPCAEQAASALRTLSVKYRYNLDVMASMILKTK